MQQYLDSFQNFTLQPSEQGKLELVFNQFAKSESDNLKAQEWLQMIMERGLMNNIHGLSFYYNIHGEILNIEQIPEKLQEEKDTKKSSNPQQQQNIRKSMVQQQNYANNIKAQEEAAKQRALLKDKMTKTKFIFMIYLTSLRVYKGYKKPVEKLFEKLFLEAHVLKKLKKDVPKFMQLDETNKKLITNQSIEVLLDYQKDLQRAYTVYYPENYDRHKIMLSWDELAMLNQKMSTFSLINLLADANIIASNKITIESFEDSMSRILPSGNSKELHFYQSNRILSMYNNDLKKKAITTTYPGDPYLYFHDFLLLLGRIAIDCCDKQQLKNDFQGTMAKFFSEDLCIRTNQQVVKDETNENSVEFFKKFRKPFSETMLRSYHQKQKYIEKKNTDQNEEFDHEPYKILELQLQNQRFLQDQQPKHNIKQLFDLFEEFLPAEPEEYKQEYEFGPDKCFLKKGNERFSDYTVIGVQPPKPPPDKNKAKQGGDKKKEKQKKKGEKEERPIVWAGMPEPAPPKTYDYIQAHNRKLEFDTVSLQDLSKGVMSNIQVKPVQLDEILYPPNCPQEVLKNIEAAILLYTQQNFYMCLQNINQAYDLWLRIDDQNDLELDQEIFFEYFKGQIFQSAGRTDLALSQFYSCKALTDKMPTTNPNRAIALCGIGNVLFRMEEFSYSLRTYLLALDIRETAIGSDNPDVANIYNNLGCCMQMMERNLEATTYFELAEAILDLEFGSYHIKTQTARRNLEKSKYYQIERLPSFQKPWVTYLKDIDAKGKGKKKDAKKKK